MRVRRHSLFLRSEYVSYAEDNLWSKNSKMPVILFVCGSEELWQRIEEQILQALDKSWKDVRFATTTSAIWQKPGELSKKFRLENLS